MKTLIKIDKPALLTEKVTLKGIEVVEAKAGGCGTDFKGIRLRDTLTNSILLIELGPYSDLNIFTEKTPTMKKVVRLSGKLDGAEVIKDFDSKEQAEKFVSDHLLDSPVMVNTEVEVSE